MASSARSTRCLITLLACAGFVFSFHANAQSGDPLNTDAATGTNAMPIDPFAQSGSASPEPVQPPPMNPPGIPSPADGGGAAPGMIAPTYGDQVVPLTPGDTNTILGPDGNPFPVAIPPQILPAETLSQPIGREQPRSNVPQSFAPGPAQGPTTPSPQLRPSEVVEVKREDVSKKRTLAIFRTSMGNFTVRLFTRQVPRMTEHFIQLARGEKEFIDAKTGRKTRRPFYNGLIFHRVIENFIIQGGCPFGNGTAGPGFTMSDEFTPNLRHRKAGIVSMASAGEKDTNGSQFMITLTPQPEFDDKYTIIGEVTQGMDVIQDIARAKVGPTDRPIKRIYIIAIDVIEE